MDPARPSRSVKSEVYAFIVRDGGSIDDAVDNAWGDDRCTKLDRAVIESWAAKWSTKRREHVDFDDEAGSLGRKLLSLRSELRDVERRWPSLRVSEVCCAFEEITGLQRRTWQRARRATHEPQIAAITALLLDSRSQSAAAGGPYAGAHEFVVELGGGKGLLSRVIARVDSSVSVVTVDRRAPAIGATFAEHDDVGEAEAGVAGDADAPRVTRVVNDIRDVDLVDVSRRFGQRSRSVTVVGKHLCADASDWAVECIARACGGRGEDVATGAGATAPELVSAVVLVPCCHPQLSAPAAGGTVELDSRRLLARLSSCEHRLLCRLIEDAKLLRAQSSSSARKQASGGGAVARWLPLLRSLDAYECADGTHPQPSWEVRRAQLLGFGRIARRVIEEDRMRSLEDCGFACTLTEIAPAALTPDNFAIVARRPADGHTVALAPTPPKIVSSGLVLLLSSRTHSALIRAAEFMLELRDAALRSPGTDKKMCTSDEYALGRALHGAWVDNSLGAVIVVGAVMELKRALQLRGTAAAQVLAPPLLQQTLRFSAFASSLEEIVHHAMAAGNFPLRVRALPRSLERQLTTRICDGSCACNPCSHLSTSAPIALLEVTALDDTSLHTGKECGADGARAFAWAITPVALRASGRATLAQKVNPRPSPHHQLTRRLAESAMRTLWVGGGGGSIGAVQAAATCAAFAGTCLVVADTVDRTDAMAIWARTTFPSAQRVVSLSGNAAAVAESAGCLAGVVFCDAGRDFGDSIDILLGLATAKCIAAGARIWSTMRQPQRKGAAAQSRRDTALLRAIGDRLGGSYPRGAPAPGTTQGGGLLPLNAAACFTCIEAHHQMSDRPWERTVQMCFGSDCAHVAARVVAV